MSKQTQLRALRPNVGDLLRKPVGSSQMLEVNLQAGELPEGFHVEILEGRLRLTCTSQGIWVNGALNSTVPAECARCLAPLSLHIGVELEELFYYPASSAPNPSSCVIGEEAFLELAQPVWEQLELNVPLRPLCRADCRGLCGQCGKDLNLGDCGCREERIDPRLAVLQQLKKTTAEE